MTADLSAIGTYMLCSLAADLRVIAGRRRSKGIHGMLDKLLLTRAGSGQHDLMRPRALGQRRSAVRKTLLWLLTLSYLSSGSCKPQIGSCWVWTTAGGQQEAAITHSCMSVFPAALLPMPAGLVLVGLQLHCIRQLCFEHTPSTCGALQPRSNSNRAIFSSIAASVVRSGRQRRRTGPGRLPVLIGCECPRPRDPRSRAWRMRSSRSTCSAL